MASQKQETRKFETRTKKELHELLFGEPPRSLTPRDFHFLAGALLAEARELPPDRGKPISDRLNELAAEANSPEKINGARGTLQDIWQKVHGKRDGGGPGQRKPTAHFAGLLR